jgi:hypothetical protein
VFTWLSGFAKPVTYTLFTPLRCPTTLRHLSPIVKDHSMLECAFTRRLTSLSSSIPISCYGTAHYEHFSVLPLVSLSLLITFRTAFPYACLCCRTFNVQAPGLNSRYVHWWTHKYHALGMTYAVRNRSNVEPPRSSDKSLRFPQFKR